MRAAGVFMGDAAGALRLLAVGCCSCVLPRLCSQLLSECMFQALMTAEMSSAFSVNGGYIVVRCVGLLVACCFLYDRVPLTEWAARLTRAYVYDSMLRVMHV